MEYTDLRKKIEEITQLQGYIDLHKKIEEDTKKLAQMKKEILKSHKDELPFKGEGGIIEYVEGYTRQEVDNIRVWDEVTPTEYLGMSKIPRAAFTAFYNSNADGFAEDESYYLIPGVSVSETIKVVK